MGNTQTGDNKSIKSGKVKSLMKIRGKRGKNDDTVQFTNIATIKQNSDKVESSQAIPVEKCAPPKRTEAIITDSWKKANAKEIDIKSGESSSESIFTDPLTPVGFSTEINKCYYSEESVSFDVVVPDTVQDSFLNLPLNNFKLNSYEIRKSEELTKKLNKLGVSRTSQISLDSDPREWFVSSNVECVTKEYKYPNELNTTSESGIIRDIDDLSYSNSKGNMSETVTPDSPKLQHSSSHFSDVCVSAG